MISLIYRQTVESASCENQTEYFNAFVVCLVILILSTGVNILLLIWILKRNQSKQEKQGKIHVCQAT